MPRISRIHFSSLGHHDARFPALTLDLRDGTGRPVDSVIWAENGTGKSSLLNLFFSTYRPHQRQFLGKQAEGKVRELADYVRDRDLAFILTEWDTTDDQVQESLLGNESPRALLIVGQALSWKGLDRANELRRLFFTLRPNHALSLESLPILGLAQPVASFEALRDWLDEQNRSFPRLEIRHTTNQSEWREHLANNHLDPELFTYQLRMNEGEGGVNNLFNNLKNDRDFIRLFLQLGFDPSSANQVRENLQQFLPKLRNRPALELQLEFNEKLLLDLDMFLRHLIIARESDQSASAVERKASQLFGALHGAGLRAADQAKSLSEGAAHLESELTRLTSQRTLLTRRQNFYRALKCRLEEAEAQQELKRCEQSRNDVNKRKRLLAMAVALEELREFQSRAKGLQLAIQREQEESKPVLQTLQELGGKLKARLHDERGAVDASISGVDHQDQQLRRNMSELRQSEMTLASEQASAQQQMAALELFFAERDAERDALRRGGWVESKESAEDARGRWENARRTAADAASEAKKVLARAINEKDQIASAQAILNGEIVRAENETGALERSVKDADSTEERIATHPQMRAAVESSRADLNLPQTSERLAEHSASIFGRILRANVEAAEDRRAQEYFDKHRLFSPPADVELIEEKLTAAGIKSATTAAYWLAFNVSDPKAAAEFLTRYPSQMSGVMLDSQLDGAAAADVLHQLSTEQIPVSISGIPTHDLTAWGRSAHSTAEHQVDPTPITTVLPRHLAVFNFEAAKNQLVKLAAQQASRREELERLDGEFSEIRKLSDELRNWLCEYGGAKLRILREKLRAAEEQLGSLHESQRKAATRHQELTNMIAAVDVALAETEVRISKGDSAVAALNEFIRHFEALYDAKRSQQQELGNRLQGIEVELSTLADTRRKYDAEVPLLAERKLVLAIRRNEFESEIRNVRYASDAFSGAEETVSDLRSAYQLQVAQYEGTFLNTKAQAELSVVLERAATIEAQLDREFRGMDRRAAEDCALQGKLADQMLAAESAVTTAHQDYGKAELKLNQARERLRDLGGTSDQERPAQIDTIPQTAVDAAVELGSLDRQYDEVRVKIDKTKGEAESLVKRCAEADRRSESYANYVQRLREQSVSGPEEDLRVEIPVDDARLAAVVAECITSLQNARRLQSLEADKLFRCYTRIQNLTQDERYAQANDLPAKSLFSHMPIDELSGCAEKKRIALDEDIKTLRADLELMGQHRETLVSSLLNVSRQAIRLLRRAERWSTMPDGMLGWEGEPFLRIRLTDPHGDIECTTRLKSLVDRLLEDGKIPAGVELVFDAIMSLVGENGVDATILKPEAQRRKVRYPVREMGGWSEGERTTVAILLYCTLVKIRSQSRGTDAGQNQVSALLLDNPVGPCSKPEFLQLHRQIAGQLGVQLIYATGINDPAALSVFPNWIRLAKNRIIPETGELAVGLVGQSDDSVIASIRVFEDVPKAHAS
jgi:hypothetical protein